MYVGLGAIGGSSASLAAQQSFASSAADLPAPPLQDDQQTYPQQPAQAQQQPNQAAAQSHAYLQQSALEKYQAAAQNMQPPEDDMELIMDTGIAFASTYVAPQATNRQGQVDQAPADDDVRLFHCYTCCNACCSKYCFMSHVRLGRRLSCNRAILMEQGINQCVSHQYHNRLVTVWKEAW